MVVKIFFNPCSLLLCCLLALSAGSAAADPAAQPPAELNPPPPIAALWAQGLAAQDKGYFITALSLVDSSLCLLQDEVGWAHPFSATAMSHLGNIYYENGYLTDAFTYQIAALEIRRDYFGPRHLETAKSYNNLANCYLAIGDYETAIAYYQQTADIRAADPTVPLTDLAAIYNNLGNAYLALGRWDAARSYYTRSWHIRVRELGATDLKTAQSQLNLGNVFAAQHQPDSALWCFAQALPIYLNHYGDQHPQLAALYENMGNALTAQQQYPAAADLLEKALAIRQQAYGGAQPDLIRLYQNIGELWLQRGDYQQAYPYFQQALELCLSWWGEYHPQVAQAHEQLGLALLYQGKPAAAKAHFLQAIALRQSLFGATHPFVAGSWLNLGNAVWEEGNYEQARQYFAQSLASWAQQPVGWRPEQLKAWLNISQTYLEQNQPEAAWQSLEQARNFLDTTQADDLASYLRTAAGAATQQAHYASADQLLDQALTALQYEQFSTNKAAHIPPPELLLCLQNRGHNRLAWARAQDDAQMAQMALQDQEEAIDWLVVLQSTYSNPAARQQMAALYQPLFEQAIATCLFLAAKTNHPTPFYQKALVLSERNKSIRLLEANFAHNHSGNRLPDTLLLAWQQTLLQLNQLEKQLALAGPEMAKPTLQNIQAEILFWQQKRSSLDVVLKKYTAKNPLPDRYLTAEKIVSTQAGLPPDEAILSFFQGRDHFYVFVLNKQEILARQLPTTFPWQTAIRDLGNSIIAFPIAPRAEKARIDSAYTTTAQLLYQQLFLPLKGHLKQPHRLLIIPDGIFNYLPFETLLTAAPLESLRYRSYPYLLHDFTISYAYSISQWLNDRERSVPFVPNRRSCLAIAPSFQKAGSEFAPLAHNLTEARAVLAYFPGKLLADTLATQQQFLAQAGEYAILHLATHALTNTSDGDYAYFVLAPANQRPTTPYGKLYVKDFYAQQWKAQLAVLSACETGIGSFRAGEGVISLGRGFAQAGVRSTVSSLWQLNDAQTALLMEQFYQLLQAGNRKDDALQTAKLRLLSQSSHDLAHPFYWASYLPYGDMAPLRLGLGSVVWWGLGVAGLLAFFGGGFYFLRRRRVS